MANQTSIKVQNVMMHIVREVRTQKLSRKMQMNCSSKQYLRDAGKRSREWCWMMGNKNLHLNAIKCEILVTFFLCRNSITETSLTGKINQPKCGKIVAKYHIRPRFLFCFHPFFFFFQILISVISQNNFKLVFACKMLININKLNLIFF